jgi:hypothetical protein
LQVPFFVLKGGSPCEPPMIYAVARFLLPAAPRFFPDRAAATGHARPCVPDLDKSFPSAFSPDHAFIQ